MPRPVSSTAAWSSLAVWLLLDAAAARAAAPKEAPGFPVELAGQNTGTGLALIDLDGDGAAEIVGVLGQGIVAVSRAGKIVLGPLELREAADVGKVAYEKAPLGCDLDGDGKSEALVAGSSARLYAVTHDGKIPAGFPVTLEAPASGELACLATPGAKGRSVALVLDNGALSVVSGDGGSVRTVARPGKGTESGIGLADFTGDGALELVVVGGDGRLHVLEQSGKAVPGFPLKLEFRVSGVPAVGDVDDDGVADLVVGSQDFKLHALALSGQELPGFPVETGYRVYGGVALADMDRDGVLDIVAGSGDSKLHVVSGKGAALAGFPLTVDGRIIAAPVVGDLDLDGLPEVVVVTQAGSLYVSSNRGKVAKPFPFALGAKAETAPALADVDADGLTEVLVQAQQGPLHAFKVGTKGKAEVAQLDWPMLGHDAEHTGRFGPNPARFRKLGWKNAIVRTTDNLEVEYVYADLDGDAEVETQIRWTVDDKPVSELNNQRVVPAERTAKHQRWRYTLQEGANFKAFGEKGVLTRSFAGPELVVANTPPPKPVIVVTPDAPTTTSTLAVQVSQQAADADGDKVTYTAAWLKDGKPQTLRGDPMRVPGELIAKNEEWRIVLTPSDGEEEGESATAVTSIQNTPPGAPALAFTPRDVRVDDVLQVQVAKPALDADGDAVTYEYRTFVNEAPLELPLDRASVPPRVLRKGAKVKIEVTSFDGTARGDKAAIELVVQNTVPPTPQLAISPAKPRTDEALVVAVVGSAEDTDRDPLTYRHGWTVDGAKADHPLVVPASATKKHQRWRLSVTPFDGQQEGKSATAEVVVENTPPEPPVLVLDRYRFATDAEVVPRVQAPAVDADGDAVKLAYRWTKNGQPAGFPETKTTLTAADTKKGDEWQLEVVPSDGEATGRSTRLAFSVFNTPPTAPVVKLSQQTPTTRDRVEVTVSTASTDVDLDALVYRHRWFRDGRPVAAWALDKRALEPGEAKKGEQWRVEVVAFDGEVEGPAASAELKVGNHTPEPPLVEVQPVGATTDTELVCKVTRAATDADGDPLRLSTRWFIDAVPVALSPELDRLPAALTTKLRSVHCEVEASDGLARSAVAKAQPIVVQNSPPGAPTTAIAPRAPRTADELVCEVTTAAGDADFDAVKNAFVWKVDGTLFPGATAHRVPATATARGQRWECEVTASDGAMQGPAARTIVTIGNTPPTPARIHVVPSRPVAGQDLTCAVLVEATDADADKVEYRYTWLKDGVPQSFARTSGLVPGRLVKAKDLWKCEVTPFDGTDDGPRTTSQDVVIGEAEQKKPDAAAAKKRRRR